MIILVRRQISRCNWEALWIPEKGRMTQDFDESRREFLASWEINDVGLTDAW